MVGSSAINFHDAQEAAKKAAAEVINALGKEGYDAVEDLLEGQSDPRQHIQRYLDKAQSTEFESAITSAILAWLSAHQVLLPPRDIG
jgi:hypothetical protein